MVDAFGIEVKVGDLVIFTQQHYNEEKNHEEKKFACSPVKKITPKGIKVDYLKWYGKVKEIFIPEYQFVVVQRATKITPNE